MAQSPEDKKAVKTFFSVLKWSKPHAVAGIQRALFPDRPGIYLFTRSNASTVTPADALYVGKNDGAKTSLRARIGGYCRTPIPNPLGEPHRGRRQIFQYRIANHDTQLFVRWCVYSDARGIEGRLIELLDPPFNTQIEKVWTDEDDIDPQYIGDPYQ